MFKNLNIQQHSTVYAISTVLAIANIPYFNIDGDDNIAPQHNIPKPVQ